MLDSLKTIGNATAGIGVWFFDFLPMVLQMIISILSIVYITLKIKKEMKNG